MGPARSYVLTSTCTSLVPSSLLDIPVLKEGKKLGLWEGLKEWQRWGCCSSVQAGSEWRGDNVCQEWTRKELWMNEVWQNCAKGVFVERITSVLCVFLPCLSAWSIPAELFAFANRFFFCMTSACSFSQSSLQSVSLYMVARMQCLLVPLMWEAAKYSCLKTRKQKV